MNNFKTKMINKNETTKKGLNYICIMLFFTIKLFHFYSQNKHS